MSKVYNLWTKNYTVVNEGETLCKECKGSGTIVYTKDSIFMNGPRVLRCVRCLGKGKMDWVEEAMGKNV